MTVQLGDRRVRAILEAEGLKFTLGEDGAFEVVSELEGGRTQKAFVSSETVHEYDVETRDVWSVAYACRDMLPQAVANVLLLDNGTKRSGAWGAVREGDTTRVLFTARVPANADAAGLLPVLQAVLTSADRMEFFLTNGADVF